MTNNIIKLIADGGSTKVDWVAINNEEIIFKTQTKGMNPNTTSITSILLELEQNHKLKNISNKRLELYFYGAGCGSLQSKQSLKKTFEEYFNNVKITIEEDTYAAVYACTQTESIIGILGTGSNSCYFDGSTITTNAPALGYIIMDEASGNYFGKELLKDYFYNKLPLNIKQELEEKFHININEVINKLYKEDFPNRYLASFTTILFSFKNHQYTQNMIDNAFDIFFNHRILPYNKPKETPIYFVGSIAYYFKENLEKAAKKHDLIITEVIQRPIDKLIEYHQKN